MSWGVSTLEEVREEFVNLCLATGANRRELCRRFGISAPTCYKWLARSTEGFTDRSRRPRSSPLRTPESVELAVLALRTEHPTWGARKLRRRLLDLGHEHMPSPSTITQILRRHDRLGGAAGQPRDWQRFEREAPNSLWQMDFKGHIQMGGRRCHPLTLLDDHSRYSLGVFACDNEQGDTVQGRLVGVFGRYGMPETILCDNSSPWAHWDHGSGITKLGAWLIRLGIQVIHGRPYHPQTQGKLERFHRTLKADAIQGRYFAELGQWQTAFDAFRHTYNHHRGHDELDLAVPAKLYSPSKRSFPSHLPEPEYDSTDLVRLVRANGMVSYKGGQFFVSRGLIGEHVGIRPSSQDGVLEVRYFSQIVTQVDLRHNLNTGPDV